MENSILYAEINCVCILILGLLSVKVRKSMFVQEQRKWLYLVIVFNMVFFVLDAVWIFMNNNVIGITVMANWILNGSYYIVSGLMGYFWFSYSESVQMSTFATVKRNRILSAVPMFMLIVLTLISVKTGWLFYIAADNSYHRGPLYFMQLLLSYGYVIVTAIKAFCLSLQTDDYGRKNDLRILSTFVIPTLMAGVLQVVFPGFPILCVGNTFGILYVYVTLQEQLVSVDALTKLNNRNQLLKYLSSKILHPNENRILYLLLLDVDYFKSINDQYGHMEGDHALKTLANCLKKVAKENNYFASRYGGDEFIVICELEPTEQIQKVCDDIHQGLKKTGLEYELSVSIGYAQYTPDIKNQQELIAKADVQLYKVKRNRKQNRI